MKSMINKKIIIIISFIIMHALLLKGDASLNFVKLDLSKDVDKLISSNFKKEEINFIKAILFSDVSDTKGSLAWIRKYYVNNVFTDSNVTLKTSIIFVKFQYPLTLKTRLDETGIIFGNAYKSESNDRDYEEYGCFFRFFEKEQRFPFAECMIETHFYTESMDKKAEQIHFLTEKFELKDRDWNLVNVQHKTFKELVE